MDRHLGYVAMSRHRARVELHWGAGFHHRYDRLAKVMSRAGDKDTSLDCDAPAPPEAPDPVPDLN